MKKSRPKKKSVESILITCAGGSASLYLAKRLRSMYRIFLADANEQNAAPHLGLPFKKIPFGSDPTYRAAILALAFEWGIGCIVPGADEELLPLLQLAPARGLKLVMPNSFEFVSLCLDKKSLMHRLAAESISELLPFETSVAVRFPAFAKPNRGRGSREAHRLANAVELEGYLKLYNRRFEDTLVQAYVGGSEYTVSVVVNDKNQLIGIVPKRVIDKQGITRAAVTEANEVIEAICRRIVERLKPRGPFNVQLKLENGKVFIFEINPRLSTTSVLTDRAFGNEVSLYLRYCGVERLPLARLPRLRPGVTLVRYDANIFFTGL